MLSRLTIGADIAGSVANTNFFYKIATYWTRFSSSICNEWKIGYFIPATTGPPEILFPRSWTIGETNVQTPFNSVMQTTDFVYCEAIGFPHRMNPREPEDILDVDVADSRNESLI